MRSRSARDSRDALALALVAAAILACGDASPPAAAPAPASSPVDAVHACVAAAGARSPADLAIVRAACSEQRSLGTPGISIAIAEAGTVTFRFAHGVRCTGRAEAVGPDTAFRIGSLTKMLTAATAFALDARGAVALDRPIGGAALTAVGLPAAVADSLAGATLRQLLDHRAGLDDHLPHEGLRGLDPRAQITALVGTPTAAPGERWRYANGGYALVGALLTHRTGAPWHALVDTEILGPVGMAHARAQADPGGDVACGHLPQGDGWTAHDVREDYDRFAFGVEAAAPAGAVTASAEDLLRFALALAEPDAPAWALRMREAITTSTAMGGARPGGRYAAGLDVTTVDGALVLRHTGSTGDFWAELVIVPDRGVAVAVLGNAGKPLGATMAAALTRVGVDPRRD